MHCPSNESHAAMVSSSDCQSQRLSSDGDNDAESSAQHQSPSVIVQSPRNKIRGSMHCPSSEFRAEYATTTRATTTGLVMKNSSMNMKNQQPACRSNSQSLMSPQKTNSGQRTSMANDNMTMATLPLGDGSDDNSSKNCNKSIDSKEIIIKGGTRGIQSFGGDSSSSQNVAKQRGRSTQCNSVSPRRSARRFRGSHHLSQAMMNGGNNNSPAGASCCYSLSPKHRAKSAAAVPVRRVSTGSAAATMEMTNKYYNGTLEHSAHEIFAGELYALLNLDPGQQSASYYSSDDDEDEFCDLMTTYPEICRLKYRFDAFRDMVYPLTMLCSLGASLKTVQTCYKLYPAAIKENYLWVGTCLDCACSYRAPCNVVEFLLQQEPKAITAVNRFGQTPLHLCCASSNAFPEVISLLIKRNAGALKRGDKYGCTSLHVACENNASAKVVEQLISAYPAACIDQSKSGCTPLNLAISQGAELSVIKLLVESSKSSLAIPDQDGQLPLHVAVSVYANVETVDYLVKSFPVGRTARNNVGETPLEVAGRLGRTSEDLSALLS